MIGQLAALMQRSPRFVRLPDGIRRLGLGLPFIGRLLRALTEPLVVDSGQLRSALQWQPPVGLEVALAATARWYRMQAAECVEAEGGT